jgi:ATP-dependent DNA helicase RecG
LRLLRVIRDEHVIEQAREDAEDLLHRDPTLAGHRELRAMINRWETAGAEFVEKA